MIRRGREGSRAQRLAAVLQLPHRPDSGSGVPGAWFDLAFVLTVSPFTGWVLGRVLIAEVPEVFVALPVLFLLAVVHAAWLDSFPA